MYYEDDYIDFEEDFSLDSDSSNSEKEEKEQEEDDLSDEEELNNQRDNSKNDINLFSRNILKAEKNGIENDKNDIKNLFLLYKKKTENSKPILYENKQEEISDNYKTQHEFNTDTQNERSYYKQSYMDDINMDIQLSKSIFIHKNKKNKKVAKYFINPMNNILEDDKLIIKGRENEYYSIYKKCIKKLEEYFSVLDSRGKSNKDRCDFRIEKLNNNNNNNNNNDKIFYSDNIKDKDLHSNRKSTSKKNYNFIISLEQRNPVLSFGISFDKLEYEKNIYSHNVKRSWYLTFSKDFGIGGVILFQLKSDKMELLAKKNNPILVDSESSDKSSLSLQNKYFYMFDPTHINSNNRIYFEINYYFKTNENSMGVEYKWLEDETKNLGKELLKKPELLEKNIGDKEKKKRLFKDYVSCSHLIKNNNNDDNYNDYDYDNNNNNNNDDNRNMEKQNNKDDEFFLKNNNKKLMTTHNTNIIDKKNKMEEYSSYNIFYDKFKSIFLKSKNNLVDNNISLLYSNLNINNNIIIKKLKSFEIYLTQYIILLTKKIISNSIIKPITTMNDIMKEKLNETFKQYINNIIHSYGIINVRLINNYKDNWKAFLNYCCNDKNQKEKKNLFNNTISFLIKKITIDTEKNNTNKTFIINNNVFDWEKVIMDKNDISCFITEKIIKKDNYCYRTKIDDNNTNQSYLYTQNEESYQFCNKLLQIINTFSASMINCIQTHTFHQFEIFKNNNSNSNSSTDVNMEMDSTFIFNFIKKYYDIQKKNENEKKETDLFSNNIFEYYFNNNSTNIQRIDKEQDIINYMLSKNTFENVGQMTELLLNLLITNIKSLAQYRVITFFKN